MVLGVPGTSYVGTMIRLAVLSCVLVIVACSRFKTSDELRAEQRREAPPDATWHTLPCEVPQFDDFGWRLDSVGPLKLRVPGRVRSVAASQYGTREYSYRSGHLFLWLAPDAGEAYRGALLGTPRWREEMCSIGERPASVAMPMEKNVFATAVRWSEAARDETLVALIRARDLEDFRLLRAMLFTLRWDDGGGRATDRR
jgi:hypothetical protein